MKEIELKAIATDPDSIKKNLTVLGCVLSAPIIQKDVIFLKQGIAYDQIKPGVIVLRIRQQNDKTFFTLKMRGTVELNKIEHEITVDNADEAAAIIKNLDFYEVMHINKVRQKCQWQNYEICLDEVENLGTFIEIEQRIESDDDSIISAQISAFLQTLGIEPSDFVHEGYDILLFKQTNAAKVA
jgi:adenylate cyclase, class 2